MTVLRTKLAILLALGFCIIDGAECTIILMTGSYQKVQIYISNDLERNLIVTGPGVQNIPVATGEALTMNLAGPGDLFITEDNVEILRTDLEAGCFNIVHTHSTAYITKTFGPIVLNQTAHDLSLVLNGCNGGHILTLKEDCARNNQNIALNHDSITINQPVQQDNQSLSFVGTMDSTKLDQAGTIQRQNLTVSGNGHHATLLSKTDGIYTVTQTN